MGMAIFSQNFQKGTCTSILDGISDPIIVIDREYNLVYSNKAAQDRSGTAGTAGEKCYTVLHGKNSPCSPCPCLHAFQSGKPYRTIRKARSLEGDSSVMEFRAYPIFDEAGEVVRMIEVMHEALPPPERFDIAVEEMRPEQRELDRDRLTSFCGMIGRSKKMKALFQMISLVSASNVTILIYGESGTGKELVARAIHKSSPRSHQPFVAIDCGALPETLLESELFGHVKGSFTGAIQNKKGLFEEAEGGTLFLDEIGDTSLAFQSKLLRVLQEGEVRPVGGNRNVKVNVRVVAATNKPLKEAIEKKAFREDLYYRLAVMPIAIPPLRERPDDILVLVKHFIQKYAAQYDKGPMVFSSDAIDVLIRSPWKGNVRELENVVARAILVSPTAEIASASLLMDVEATSMMESRDPPLSVTRQETVSKVERETIVHAIQKTNGNKSLAARALGISRASLYNKLKRYHIEELNANLSNPKPV